MGNCCITEEYNKNTLLLYFMKYNESKESPIDDTNRKMRESYRRSVVRYSIDSIKDQLREKSIPNIKCHLDMQTLKKEENQDMKIPKLKSENKLENKLENCPPNENEKQGFDLNSNDVFKRHETLSHFNNKQKDDFITIRSLLSDRTKTGESNNSPMRQEGKNKEEIFKFQITKKLKYSSSSYLGNKKNNKKLAKANSKKMTLLEDISTRKTFKNTTLGDKNKSPFMRKENTDRLTKTKKLEGHELNLRKSITNKAQSNQILTTGVHHKIKSIKKYDYLFSDVSPEKVSKNAEKSPSHTEVFNIQPIQDSPKRRNTRSIHSGIYSNLFI